MRLIIFFCLLLLPAGAAHAEWLRSSSAHFVVYANDSEGNIRRFSEQLERYDAAMGYLTGVDRDPPSPSNRVTVYVVRDVEQVREIMGPGAKASNIAGFYIPRAGASLAVIPRVTAAQGDADLPMLVLLHEYAHHFLISLGGFPLPRWMSEGGAEFFAQATFDKDGGLGIGRPANLRMIEMRGARDIVDVQQLVDPLAYDKRKDRSFDAFYAKSWGLYHYLIFNAARKGQLRRYEALMTQGRKSPEAALEAFGDLKVLDREVTNYMNSPRMTAVKLPATMLKIGGVEVRKLTAGEAATMSVRVRSRRGVNKEQAAALLVEARAIAIRFPSDPHVLSILAEAEYDAGNDTEALTAANAALAIDRGQVEAYIEKGKAQLRMAGKAENKAAAFDAARATFVALNKLENNHPLPLMYYCESFVRQGVNPPAEALRGLEIAASLAPFDMALRMNLARQQLRNRQPNQARNNLIPVAYNPHGGPLTQSALQMLARMDSDPNWDGRAGPAAPLAEQVQDGAK